MKQEVKDKIVEIVRHMNQLQEACGMPKISVAETLMFQHGFTDGYEYAAKKQSPMTAVEQLESAEKKPNRLGEFVGAIPDFFIDESPQEGGTVEAEEVLDKFLLFPQYIKDDIIPAMTEYASQVSATDKKRIEELEKEVERVGIMLVKAMGEVNDRDLEVERLRGIIEEQYFKSLRGFGTEQVRKDLWNEFKANNNL